MQRHLVWIIVAVMGIGGPAWMSTAANAEEKDAIGTPAQLKALQFPAGFVAKDLHEDRDIRGGLARVTEDALKNDHFDNLIGNFVDQDRDRMKDDKKRDVTELNTRLTEIRDLFKSKYGQDFNIDRDVFKDQLAILQGEVSDSDVAMQNWPVPVTAEVAALGPEAQGHAMVAGAVQGRRGEINLEKGRNVALVRYPTSHSLPALDLSLIHELPDRWRFDIPNNISGQQIYDSLLKHLTYLKDNQSNWPDDINDGYRLIAHHVYMSLYNVDVPTMAGEKQGG